MTTWRLYFDASVIALPNFTAALRANRPRPLR
jgi:hypothetical protein